MFNNNYFNSQSSFFVDLRLFRECFMKCRTSTLTPKARGSFLERVSSSWLVVDQIDLFPSFFFFVAENF